MYLSSILSTLHLFALVLGLPAVFWRGRALRAKNLSQAFVADNVWGVAAILWLATGLLRVFGPFEKGTDYYFNSRAFWLKMALFGAVFVLEIYPMVTLIRLRIQRAKNENVDNSQLPLLAQINQVEVVLMLLIPFIASAMARGLGY